MRYENTTPQTKKVKQTVKLKAYSDGNLGDDLFIEIICKRYPQAQFILCGYKNYNDLYRRIPNLTYISYDSLFIRIKYFVSRKLKSLGLLNTDKSMLVTEVAIEEKYSKKADINVYITGSGFMNDEKELETLPQKFVDENHYYNRKPYLIGCNFGPFAHNEYLDMYTKLFSKATDICFRDSYSVSLFPSLSNVRWTYDVVFNYDISNIKNPNIALKDYMLISVANLRKDRDIASEYSDEYIEMIKRIVIKRNERKQATVLLGFSKEQGDDIVIKQIFDDVFDERFNSSFCYPDISSESALSLFKAADSVLATRYHAMILGMLFEKPVCTVSYNEKTQHVLEDIERNVPFIKLDEIKDLDIDLIEKKKTYKIPKEKLSKIKELSNKQFEELDKVLN